MADDPTQKHGPAHSCTCHPDDRPDGPCPRLYAATDCQRQARIEQLEAEVERLREALDSTDSIILNNDPNETIADNGMTVWDGLVHDAAQRAVKVETWMEESNNE